MTLSPEDEQMHRRVVQMANEVNELLDALLPGEALAALLLVAAARAHEMGISRTALLRHLETAPLPVEDA